MKKETVKRASLRKKETEKKYQETKQNNQVINYFDYKQENIIKEYKYWVIIENKYPHDLITKTSHLLIPKRVFGKLDEANEEEQKELKKIRFEIHSQKKYNAILEPIGGSVPTHFHFHLWIFLKYDEIKKLFINNE